MHPAKSVIIFTSLSGAGYGLLIMSVIARQMGWIDATGGHWPVAMIIGIVLVSGGLLASTVHLGHPERAWRAMSQWRTSWLSREGVLALLTYVPWTLNLVLWWFGVAGSLFTATAILAAVLALATLYTTSMIYRTLKPVAAWSNGFVVPIYLLFGLTSGLVLLCAIVFDGASGATKLVFLSQIALVVSLIVKRIYWRFIDRNDAATTLQSATGLKGATLSVLEQPHSGENYLLKEMGFQIGRKYASKLRDLCSLLLLGAVIALALIGVAGDGLGAWMVSIAVALSFLAVLVERWLFFAEAKHTQALYYGH